jgi:hypothetical protein
MVLAVQSITSLALAEEIYERFSERYHIYNLGLRR